eukprot:408079-Lingulodinium_polyedra.AAC.1
MKAQQKASQRLVYHAFPEWASLIVVGWTDAGHANRPDGSSTEGVLVGISTDRLSQGLEDGVDLITWR